MLVPAVLVFRRNGLAYAWVPIDMRRVRSLVVVATVAALVAGACGSTDPAALRPRHPATAPDESLPPAVVIPEYDIAATYDPVSAGEELPLGFRQVLGRDDIAPVYEPRFVHAAQADWRDTSLVIGVYLEEEARAYPVGFLTRREIVVDNHRGIPTLVTW